MTSLTSSNLPPPSHEVSALLPETGSLSIPSVPHLTEQAAARLAELLSKAMCYLEYGAGGSTLLAQQIGVPVIVSVESDPEWLAALRAQLPGHSVDDNTRILLHADIGPTGKWGRAMSEDAWRQWHNYPISVWSTCRQKDIHPDLILIDGRFRVACLYACVLFARPGTPVLFDDYPDRSYYHSVEKFVQPMRRYERMVEFVVPNDINRDAVWLALFEASGDQR